MDRIIILVLVVLSKSARVPFSAVDRIVQLNELSFYPKGDCLFAR